MKLQRYKDENYKKLKELLRTHPIYRFLILMVSLFGIFSIVPF